MESCPYFANPPLPAGGDAPRKPSHVRLSFREQNNEQTAIHRPPRSRSSRALQLVKGQPTRSTLPHLCACYNRWTDAGRYRTRGNNASSLFSRGKTSFDQGRCGHPDVYLCRQNSHKTFVPLLQSGLDFSRGRMTSSHISERGPPSLML